MTEEQNSEALERLREQLRAQFTEAARQVDTELLYHAEAWQSLAQTLQQAISMTQEALRLLAEYNEEEEDDD